MCNIYIVSEQPATNGSRVTQADIASAAGVHRTTVSMVLRNHPSIPSQTKKRIIAVAQQLGYAPDPMLSSLIAYRSRNRRHVFQGTLAWLANSAPSFDWRHPFMAYYQGAKQRAAEYGYRIEVFDAYHLNISSQRLASILLSRNIQGILLAPQPTPKAQFSFPWEKFSSITFGHTLVDPSLHRVAPSQYQGGVVTVTKLRELGYNNIGLLYTSQQSDRVANHYLAAYLADQVRNFGNVRIPPLASMEQFLPWFKRYRPDALIISTGKNELQRIRNHGIRVPQDAGVAFAPLPNRYDGLSGVTENLPNIGATGIDVVVAMIQHGERGVPAKPLQTLVGVDWIQGATTRPQAC